jgi:hypothetical protein
LLRYGNKIVQVVHSFTLSVLRAEAGLSAQPKALLYDLTPPETTMGRIRKEE